VSRLCLTQTHGIGSAQLGRVLGEAVAARPRAGLQAAQLRKGFKEDSVFLFTFSNISNIGILIIIFT
jgi:hypothetical protein